jgi:hypothetical protein
VVRQAFFRVPVAVAQLYHNRRRQQDRPSRLSRLELVISAVVLALVIAGLLVFLLVYHDLPFRLSGGG